VIIATAGHVDHGKTSLIRQLTGVETDKLAEEQRRGLSISLGYAYLTRGEGTPIGFIDVPGHQRFINNMISGISGIDIGMLVIGADDGPMPQTYEHMDVLQLLGVQRLIVVISKIDRVPAARVAEVIAEVESILATRPWADTAIFPISNTQGSGIESLKSHLLERAEDNAARDAGGFFRLSIDRAFTGRGAGLIVTGTASAGAIAVGDVLTLLPQDVAVRVRGIRVHDEAADRAMAGQRCALNLAGKLEVAAIDRGDWLVEEGAGSATSRLDVHFSLLGNAPFPVKHLAPVKLHIGAKRVAGRLALLTTKGNGNRLAPGDSCLAQLILAGDVACFRGERFLLRDHAENVILGGGIILDPNGPQSGKSRPERIAWLNAMLCDSPQAALTELVTQDQLVNFDRFGQVWNLRGPEMAALRVDDFAQFSAAGANWVVSRHRWDGADTQLLKHVAIWHTEQPQLAGIKVTDLKSALVRSCEAPLVMAVLTSRLHSGELVLFEGRIRRANFRPAVSALAARQWQQFQGCLQRGGNQIPLLSEVSAETGVAQPALVTMAKTAVKRGELHCVSERRYALPDQLYQLAGKLLSCYASGEAITVISMKACFGTGRNLTVEILEYFDRIHFTRRQGDRRVILDAELPEKLFNR